MLNETHPDLPFLIPVIADACRVASAVQSNLEHVREVTKDDRSPVTVADFAVQAIVAMALLERDSSVRIVGEEKADVLRTAEQKQVLTEVLQAVQTIRPGATEDEVLHAIDHCDDDGSGHDYWALDPIDGTKGFLRGQQYAIALGHLTDKQVDLGVMGCPNLPADHDVALDGSAHGGQILVAAKNQGAWSLGSHLDEAEPKRIHARTDIQSSGIQTCESVEAGHSKRDHTKSILQRIGDAGEPVRLDSQCKYGVVARGQADAYLRLPTSSTYIEKIWDHAAGMIIASEAGAIVSDVSGSPLDFTHGARLEANRGIICASPAIHSRIIEAIDHLGIAMAAKDA